MPSPYLWTEVAESALTGTAAVDSLIYGYQWASSTLTFSFPGFGAT